MTAALRGFYAGRPQPLRWTGDAYDRVAETGVFDGQRVELIDGELLEMAPMNDPHAQAVQLANYALLAIFPPGKATISIQCPMHLGESRPLPDLVIVPGTAREVIKHPTTALLVVEVSDTTLEFHQTEKATLYASHLIPEFRIINLKSQCLEVRRKPLSEGNDGPAYSDLQILTSSQTVSPLAAKDLSMKVADLLP